MQGSSNFGNIGGGGAFSQPDASLSSNSFANNADGGGGAFSRPNASFSSNSFATKAGDGAPQNKSMGGGDGNKLFVGRLSQSTTDESLKAFFSQFGEVVHVKVMLDRETGRSKGFGFVTMGSKDELDAALNSRPHEIDGTAVDSKEAIPQDRQSTPYQSRPISRLTTTRIYLSGVTPEHTEEDFIEHFNRYGTVSKVDIVLDPVSKQRRGFAFVHFNDVIAVDKCLLDENMHTIRDALCSVKRAFNKPDLAKLQFQDSGMQMRGTFRAQPYNMMAAGGRGDGGFNSWGGYFDGGQQQSSQWGGGYVSAYGGSQAYPPAPSAPTMQWGTGHNAYAGAQAYSPIRGGLTSQRGADRGRGRGGDYGSRRGDSYGGRGASNYGGRGGGGNFGGQQFY